MTGAEGTTPEVLNVADCPLSIDVLLALRDGRDWEAIGLRLEPNILAVDWDALLDSYLSSTEKATVRLVRAVAAVEGKGGLPGRVHEAVAALLADLIPGSQAVGAMCELCGEPVLVVNGQWVHDATPPTPHRARPEGPAGPVDGLSWGGRAD